MTTEGSSFGQPNIPKFDGDHEHWSLLMENLLRSKEYWCVVETAIPAEGENVTAAQRKNIDEMKLKDLKAKNYLFSSIDKSILKTITKKDTSKQLWDSMKMRYQGSARVQRAQLNRLRRDFEILAMKTGESITDYFGRVMVVANEMRNCGDNMDDVKIVEKILRTLTDKWNFVVCSIEESKDIDEMTVDELQSSLLVHEQKFKRNHDGDDVQALKVTYDDSRAGRGRGRFPLRGRGRGRGRTMQSRDTIDCYKCHKLRHYQFECPEWNKETNYAAIGEAKGGEESEQLLLMAYTPEVTKSNVWFLDSGCSNHMSGDPSWFSDLNQNHTTTVKLGNNMIMKVGGQGNVKIKLNGVTHIVSDVYYGPELRNNLLSMGQLQERGLAILIKGGVCKIFHPRKGLIIETVMSANRMFMLQAEPKSQSVGKEESCLPLLENVSEVCKDCLVGKHHREPFPSKSTWRASQVLELIHADLCGPISPASNSNKRYTLCFIDDFSRKSWVYFLTEKSETFYYFKCFKKLVEKETGLPIKCLRTDRGGEFNSDEFKEMCRENGIQRQLTAAYTPQQNGVSERKNRTILSMARAVLSDQGIPKRFWAEVVNWSNYVLNRCPNAALIDITPEEAWSGNRPSISHLRVFGCLANVHIPQQQRTKLDDRSMECVLLGFSDESKAYKLLNPTTNKIIVSRDVIFQEHKGWDWIKTHSEEVLVDLEWDDEVITDESDVAVVTNEVVATNEEDAFVEENTHHGRVNEAVTRSGRNVQPPRWMNDYASGDELENVELNLTMAANSDPVSDPLCYNEAVKMKHWRVAMMDEIKSIEKNNTWSLIDLPKGAKTVGVKWIYKTKLNENGELQKHKARLVAKGYSQRYGVDHSEVYAPVARMETVRTIIAVAAQQRWKIFQLDVKSAFLHGKLNEDVYVDQPQGFEVKGSENKVYKLHKALYGLKQAPRAWFNMIDSYFVAEGFEKCPNEQTLFTKKNDAGNFLIVSIYVDDLIYTCDDETMLKNFKESMMKSFDMTDFGIMRYFLGIEVSQGNGGNFICQRRYATEVLKRFGMFECKAVKTPIAVGMELNKDESGVAVSESYYKQIVGCLMYLTSTRPDLMYGVSLVSRYMNRPTELHLQAIKRILRYIKGTLEYGVMYQARMGGLIGYTDSDYARDTDDRRSTSGYVFMLSNGAVSWLSKKQPIVTLSTTEAEFVAAAGCSSQAIWLMRVLEKLGCASKEGVTIYCDNSSTIKLSKNPVMHGRSKHIDVRFHFLRELVQSGVINLRYCDTKQQFADVMTKPLPTEAFERLRNFLGVTKLEV
ncbi:retrovirus-related pol polyprotein from transposon TNT 1-94 [Tanacetum coccineum]|uniref:Retrovirus-related pol polyprotein from transposon TNT 1-94 n=1 Tax=Tanacetum coccineum TaxID=301880 RepID=A0ABQ5ARL3_9ASTR